MRKLLNVRLLIFRHKVFKEPELQLSRFFALISGIPSTKTCFPPSRDLTNVFAITTAKVPIVKFTFTQGRSPGAARIDGDISLYNTLALHNTRMLALYSELDPRVKTLGNMIAYCDIGKEQKVIFTNYSGLLMFLGLIVSYVRTFR